MKSKTPSSPLCGTSNIDNELTVQVIDTSVHSSASYDVNIIQDGKRDTLNSTDWELVCSYLQLSINR